VLVAVAGALLFAASAVKKLAFDTPAEPPRTAPTTATHAEPPPPTPAPAPAPTTPPDAVVVPAPASSPPAPPKLRGSRGTLRPPPASETPDPFATKVSPKKPRPIDRDNPFGTP
jgi:hypothetical protein